MMQQILSDFEIFYMEGFKLKMFNLRLDGRSPQLYTDLSLK